MTMLKKMRRKQNVKSLSILMISIFFISCKKDNPNIDSIDSNLVCIKFINAYNHKVLSDYEFAIEPNSVELPLDYILKKSNSSRISFLRDTLKKYNQDKDSLFGFFYKKGFIFKKFSINKNKNSYKIDIFPTPNKLKITLTDKGILKDVDSFKIILKPTFHRKDISDNKRKEVVSEQFTILTKNLNNDLTIFEYDIEFGESVSILLERYKKGFKNEMVYKFDYQLWTNHLIEVH
jgi:hypothetical protein